jgi:hypothetical protein
MAASAEFRMDKIIGSDGNGLILQWQHASTFKQRGDEGARVHRRRFVAEHRLGSGCGDDPKIAGLWLAFTIEWWIFQITGLGLFLDYLLA